MTFWDSAIEQSIELNNFHADMTTWLKYLLITALLLAAELVYFRIADKCNIIDKPNQRSSHSSIVLRGGGIIFVLGLWIWAAFFGFHNIWFLIAVTLVAGVSFIDDIHSLPDSVRLVAQFAAMALMFYQLDMLHWNMWWIILIAMIVCVGASNIINFMDGVNGITGAYAMASLLPLFLLNKELGFADESLIAVVALADIVFCCFNFRPKGKAKCFAGDVGSIGVAYILLFLIGSLILATGDVTYLILLLVYGVDGCLTICHRILLHENLGEEYLAMNLDLRNSAEDGSQRMLNALEPGTILPIHRHTRSTETVVLIRGSVRQNYYNPDGSLAQSFIAAAGTSPNAPTADCMGFSVPLGQWHNTECLESGTVFIECKDGAYAPLGPEDVLETQK